MPRLPGAELPYVEKVYGALNKGIMRLGALGAEPKAATGYRVSGLFGKNIAASNYYRRRGIAYGVGISSGAMGLMSRSSGGNM